MRRDLKRRKNPRELQNWRPFEQTLTQVLRRLYKSEYFITSPQILALIMRVIIDVDNNLIHPKD